jgi:hypothetical protein
MSDAFVGWPALLRRRCTNRICCLGSGTITAQFPLSPRKLAIPPQPSSARTELSSAASVLLLRPRSMQRRAIVACVIMTSLRTPLRRELPTSAPYPHGGGSGYTQDLGPETATPHVCLQHHPPPIPKVTDHTSTCIAPDNCRWRQRCCKMQLVLGFPYIHARGVNHTHRRASSWRCCRALYTLSRASCSHLTHRRRPARDLLNPHRLAVPATCPCPRSSPPRKIC